MITSDSVINIAKALTDAQKKITHATKDSKNPHFKTDYASLESVIDATRGALLESGVIVIQSVSDKALTTRLQHVSGEYFESYLSLILQKQDMQGLGSAVTYARRYSLAAMLNISQADDDGCEAAKPAPKKHIAEKVQEQSDNNKKDFDFDGFVISFGKKMAGKKLRDFSADDHIGMITYLELGAKNTGKELSGPALAYYDIANAYVQKVDGFPPPLNAEERVPF